MPQEGRACFEIGRWLPEIQVDQPMTRRSIGDDDAPRDDHDATDVAVVVAAAVAGDGSSAKERRPDRSRSDYSFHFVVNMARLEAVRLCYTD